MEDEQWYLTAEDALAIAVSASKRDVMGIINKVAANAQMSVEISPRKVPDEVIEWLREIGYRVTPYEALTMRAKGSSVETYTTKIEWGHKPPGDKA